MRSTVIPSEARNLQLGISLRGAAAMLLLCASATSLASQLPSASAAAFGMGGNFTAIAKGYEAVAWNAANLAMPGRPFFSLGIGIAGGTAGLDPIDVRTLNEFSGLVVDSVTRVSWIEEARRAGGQGVHLDGGITPLALSLGPIGLHVGTSTYTSMRLSPDAFEAYLFGNAGLNNGQPKALDLTGTRVRAGAFSTGGVSIALPFPLMVGLFRDERAAIGVTGKYIIGHGLLFAQDLGSTVGANDILLNFPVITSTADFDNFDAFQDRAGSGTAADVSFAWSGGPFKVGAVAQNVINNFKWDVTKLEYRPGTGTFNGADNTTDFDRQPYANAPQALRELVEAQGFKPAYSVGVAFQPFRGLTLTGDLKQQTGGDDAIVIGPKSHMGVGAEWRIIPMVPLRAGVASVTDGWQAGVGAGFSFLGYELDASTAIRKRGPAIESGLMVGIVGIGR
jgi:hypothetical protein